jgi:hypothetical protein
MFFVLYVWYSKTLHERGVCERERERERNRNKDTERERNREREEKIQREGRREGGKEGRKEGEFRESSHPAVIHISQHPCSVRVYERTLRSLNH